MKKSLCLKFCHYYKPSKDERLACLGFLVVKGLIERGEQIPFAASAAQVPPLIDEELTRTMCPSCPFYVDGCDFVLGTENAPPCGGFALLRILLHTECIRLEDVEQTVNRTRGR